MTTHLISCPSGVMQVAEGERDQEVDESHQIIRDVKAAGVSVFGGGINGDVAVACRCLQELGECVACTAKRNSHRGLHGACVD